MLSIAVYSLLLSCVDLKLLKFKLAQGLYKYPEFELLPVSATTSSCQHSRTEMLMWILLCLK